MSARLRCSTHRPDQRGVTLILVLMVTAVFLILMGSLIDVLAIESQDSIESANADAALTAAYSGVNLMVLSIEEFYQNGLQNGQFPTAVTCGFNQPGGGNVMTDCNASVNGARWHTQGGLNYYLIDSTGDTQPEAGSTNQEITRSVRALVRQVPFGAYAMFTESEVSNTDSHTWYTSGQSYGGPVYSGGNMHIRYDSTYSGCTGGPPCPIFPDGFTTSGDPSKIQWFDVADDNHSPPTSSAEIASVFGSNSGMNAVQNQIPLPGLAQNLAVFSEAYFGDDTHGDLADLADAGCGSSVCVNGSPTAQNCGRTLCTGIFINGSADVTSTATPSANGDLSSGTETWTFTPGSGPNPIVGTVVITVDYGAQTTTVNGTQYQGVASGESSGDGGGNGAIFVNGDLTIASGSQLHGQYTIATPDPPQNNESMTLNGSLTYADNPQGPSGSQDELALWADKIWLASTVQGNITIDGMLLTGFAGECTDKHNCGGWFANSACGPAKCNGGVGTLSLYGSIIENMRGKLGFVDKNDDPIGGYLRTATYDPRLGQNPPPFSPTTNLFSIVAVTDQDGP